ncbi:hypothetical protein Hanom_Chr11g01045181 [Helianthus anomalus]
MIPTSEISSEAETNAIERLAGTAEPASIGAGAGANENSAYSLPRTAVMEIIRTTSAIADLIAPPAAIVQQLERSNDKC